MVLHSLVHTGKEVAKAAAIFSGGGNEKNFIYCNDEIFSKNTYHQSSVSIGYY
jgi:hypothetical protein